MSKKSIKVVIRNTDDIVYQGDVERITSFNEVGQFDVYPMHANFISIIQKNLTLYHENKLVKELKLEKGIMKVKQDEVNIFLGIESLAIDEEKLGESNSSNSSTPKTN